MFSLLSKTGFVDMILKLSLWLNTMGHRSLALRKTLLHTFGNRDGFPELFLLLSRLQAVQLNVDTGDYNSFHQTFLFVVLFALHKKPTSEIEGVSLRLLSRRRP